MENSYGIGITNRYALFLDDDADPLEVLKVQEQEKELKKKTKIAEKENKGKTEPPAKGKVANTQRKPIKETQNQKPHDVKREENKPGQRPIVENRTDRSKVSNFTENREERNNRRNKEEKTFNGSAEGNREREERPRRDFSDNLEAKNRGRGAPRPRGGRGRMFDQRGKREFDRQSGSDKTGVKPVDKREGGGAHNWGSHKDIMEELDKSNEIDPSWGDMGDKPEPPTTEAKGEVTTTDGEVPPTTAPMEEEPKQITLDEWRAQKAARQKPQYNLRKAGEGEDPSQWKKMYELNKKKEGKDTDGEEEESDEEDYDVTAEYPQRVGRQKHVLDINIHFSDRRVGGGGRGRGGRPGPGGRGGRGGGPARGEPRAERAPGERPPPRNFRAQDSDQGEEVRGEGRAERGERGPDHAHKASNRQNAPKVDDEHDFPSLS